MLGGVEGHVHAGHGADRFGPLPGAVHDDAGFDVALIGANPGDEPAGHRHPDDPGPLEDPRPELACALGEGLRDIGGVGGSVARKPDGALQVARLQNWDPLEGLGGGEDLAFKVEGFCSRGGAE